ncbi:MAG: TolC family protein, partial [Pseudomonadota bacterium]
MSWQHYILIVTLTVIPTLTRSQSLPEPLSLQAALDTAENESHYDILNLDHRIKALQAKLGVEAGEQGFRLDFEGRIREVGPSEASPSNDSGDNAASLILSRPVYDFGYSNAQTSVMEMQLESLLLERKITIGSRKLKILEQYFDVLNADNTFISENEALAIDFIRFDRARENQELGKISEIEVLRL